MNQNDKILVTGGAGFLGSAVVEELLSRGYSESNISCPRSKDFDLREKSACAELAAKHNVIIHLAATVGGIGFNQKYPADLIFDNTIMGVNLIDQAHKNDVSKFVFVGTTCSYPKFCPIPFKEDSLWDGYPEETNAPYGVAKKTLGLMLEAYHQQHAMKCAYVIPVNLYGPRDNFDLESSHVIPALIRKFVEAKDRGESNVTLWGDGSPTREFLYVKDAARGIVMAAEKMDNPVPVNLGSKEEVKIADLAELLRELIGFDGEIVWDKDRPNGQPRRKLDTARAKEMFGYESEVSFREGLEATIDWWRSQS